MHFQTTNPLLMLIDLQKAIYDPSWGTRNNQNAETQITNLLQIWREKKLPILHVKHMSTDPNSTYLPGTPGNDFKDFAKPTESEEILEKSSNSAFIQTDLDSMLQSRDINEIVIIGVITNNSVEATARMAGNLGYRTFVIADATYTFDKIDFGGVEHKAEVVHNMSLANLHGEYAQVVCTKEVLNLLGNTTA